MFSLGFLPVYLADSMALGQQARWHRLVSNMQKTFREKDCLAGAYDDWRENIPRSAASELFLTPVGSPVFNFDDFGHYNYCCKGPSASNLYKTVQ